VADEGFIRSEPQALLELLAARCMSHQPKVLVILTDMTTGAVSYTLDYDAAQTKFTIKRYQPLSLTQMGRFVSSFLTDSCVPQFNFVPRVDLNDPRQMQPIEFKRRRLSAPQLPPEWEQFMDIMEDRDSTDTERQMVTRQLYRSFESYQEASNDGSWLSMYT
jgi:hypothetical protein